MNIENNKSWNTLYEKYPELFVNRHKSPMESCMSFGIECNLGWYNILSSLCWTIKQHEENIASHKKHSPETTKEYYPVKFDQVKEKFGGLRAYYSGGNDYIRGLVTMAETMSYKICEVCGNKGKANKSGWIITLCDGCRKS